MKRTFLLLSLLVPTFAGGQSFVLGIDVDDPPEGPFFEEWAEMFVNGEKIGYTRNAMERRGDLVITHAEAHTRMGRAESMIESSNVSEIRERIDGTPLSITAVQTEGGRSKTQRIRFTGEGAVVTTTAGGRTWDHEVTLEPGFVVSWSFVRALEALGKPEPGTTATHRLYSPDITINQALPVTTVFEGEETIRFRNRPVQALRIAQEIRVGFLPLKLTVWVDEEGRLLRGIVPIGGLEMELAGADEQQAKADFDAPDLFSSTLIPLNRPVPFEAEAATYRLRASGGLSGGIPDSAFQTVQREDEGVYRIEVRRGRLAEAESPGAADPVYLQPSPLVDFEDPVVKALLPEGLENAGFAEKVARLVRATDEAIETKSMDLGFASASETAGLREGDCTEHALLLAALARAAGIPARGASGLVGFPGEQGQPTLGYHMWTQVWNGSRWLDVDAAYGEAETSPVRILLGTSTLSDPGFLDEALAIADLIGRAEVEIIAVEPGK